MSTEKIRPSFTFTEDRLAELKAVVPEAFPDGELDWDTLREALGAYLDDEDAPVEHFGLNWPGKREARRLAAKPSHGTLRFVPGEGVNEETAHNIFIEGDNLEVLKILQKSYAGRIKMIYIDPPYNTGNDFVYKDDFKEPLANYLKKSGQMGGKAELLTSNPKGNGRFHSNWLNMIYPRLRLAKNLLHDDGIIFVSIDDNECNNLKLVMDEIFGEECFIEEIIWKNKYGSGAMTTGFANVHEYIYCYSKKPISSIEASLDEEQISNYKMKDLKYEKRGGYLTQPLATNSKDPRPNLRYPITHQGKEIWPEKQWVWSEERFLKAYKNDEIVINEKNGKFSVRMKQYLRDENGIIRKGKPVSIFNGPFNQDGTREIDDLFGDGVFNFPKPSALIKKLISFSVNGNDGKENIILDFFAGSASTAHAVMSLNREDKGNRKYILVQIPDDTPEDSVARKYGFKSIPEISKERIRRVIHVMNAEMESKSEKKLQPSLLDEEIDVSVTANDLGFLVYKLDSSNFKAWKDYEGDDLKALQLSLDEQEVPLVEGWTIESLLDEIILLEGFPLDSDVGIQAHFTHNLVQTVSSTACAHKLWVCFDPTLHSETVAALALPVEDVFICLDSALDDNTKLRLTQAGTLKTI